MADGKLGPFGDCGERGERGKRGERGERGERGRTGDVGATGPTGATPPIAFDNFVFRPGGVQADNVFTDWADLVAAATLVQGHKTIQFDNSIVSPVVIPPGVWDMTQVEWTGFIDRSPPSAFPLMNISDGASFTNLLKIGGDLRLTNLNTVNAPVVISQSTLFELGAGGEGDFPTIQNNSTAPFFDCSSLPVGQAFLLRMQGVIQGTSPGIQFGASSATFQLTLYDAARLAAGMLAGTNPAAVFQIFNFGMGGQVNRQAAWAGDITYGRPNLFTGTMGWGSRFWTFPAAVNQVNPAPSTVAITPATGLGMNTCLRFNTTAGAIAQTLPIIRAAAPAIGSISSTPGSLEATGLIVIVKNEIGANPVNVSPDATTPDTIDGGAGPIAVPAGGSRTFMSNGVSNWSIVGGFL